MKLGQENGEIGDLFLHYCLVLLPCHSIDHAYRHYSIRCIHTMFYVYYSSKISDFFFTLIVVDSGSPSDFPDIEAFLETLSAAEFIGGYIA